MTSLSPPPHCRVTQFAIECGWGKISGQIFGNRDAAGSRPIFALHGFLDNSNSFKPVAPYITSNAKYHIIAIDLPGMGLSSPIPDGIPYSTKFYLMSLRRVTEHFKLTNFTFMTHSFGCSLALAVCLFFSSKHIFSKKKF
jgi:pimeloyl-ACP methyl ester carboxylesterase